MEHGTLPNVLAARDMFFTSLVEVEQRNAMLRVVFSILLSAWDSEAALP